MCIMRISEYFKRIANSKDKAGKILSADDVRVILRDALGSRLNPHVLIILSDEAYTTINRDQVLKAFKISNLGTKEYRPEVFDCDNFAFAMKAVVDEEGRKLWSLSYEYAFGIVYGSIPTPHAINWFITSDLEVLFIEPQSGEIFAPIGENIVFLYT